MKHQHQNVFPCSTNGGLQSESGEQMTPPDDWIFLPAGDAAVTRCVKSKCSVWVVRIKHRRRIISKGIWAPGDHVLAARREVADRRATPVYAKKRKQDLARRQAELRAYELEFNDQIVRFLNFHPRYEKEAEYLGKIITAHATPVGSGTVARTRRIPIDKRAQAAVIAWMRHETTGYESMRIPRVKGKRREIRRKLAAKSIKILEKYRQGLNLIENCPLKQAMAKIQNS